MPLQPLIGAFHASKSSGHRLLLSRYPQLTCDSSCGRHFQVRSYSTDRVDSVKSSAVDTSVGMFKKKKYEDEPERRAEYLRKSREYDAQRRATNPEFFSKRRERMRDRRLQPEVRLYHKEKNKTWYRSQSMKPGFLLKENLRNWIRRYTWVREDLNWTPWEPVFYPNQVEHRCQGCNLARHRGSQIWWTMDSQKFMCHSCYMKLPEGGLPKGYEDCTTIEEIAKRKETLETRLSPSPTTSTLTSQSWRPSKTSPTGSRPFSTFRALWTKSKEQKLDEEGPPQGSQPKKWTELEAKMLEAKHQYEETRSAWKSAKNVESGSQEVTEADVREAKLRSERAKHAWRTVSDPEYKARLKAGNHRRNQKPKRKEYNLRLTLFKRATDPLYKLRELVYNWTRYWPLARQTVDWTPYQPILYSAKVRLTCQGCGYQTHSGRRLWWRRKPDPAVNVDLEVYSCHQCFIKSPDGGLPEAYKDCATLRELNQRCQEIEGVRPREDRESFDVEVETIEQKNHDLGADHRV